MLTLNDGRYELWQWDTGRTLSVDADCSQVHFSNKVFGRSIDVDVVDGVAIIPDILLQTDKELNVWAFVGTPENGYTKISKTFKVNRRNKPAGYVFTPADQMTLQTIQIQIGDLADLTTDAKTTLVAAINEAARSGGGAGSMDLRVVDGYIQYSTDGGMTWTNLIAMADLKGDTGAPGKDGHSPVVTATKSGKTTTISVDGAAIATVEDGVDGKPGAAGADGVTPHIGDNGNWYVGSTDTGKPSRGATGAPGKDGAGMDITGATVGQIAKISAVDENGVPTAWDPVDMPSGGGGDDGAKEFRLIQSITLGEQSDRVDISVDSSGSAFALHEVYVMISAQSYDDAYHEVNFLPNGRWGSSDAFIVSSNKASKSSETWKNNMTFHAVYSDGIICSEQLPAKGQNYNLSSSFSINQAIITKISIVCKFAAGCTFLVIGR